MWLITIVTLNMSSINYRLTTPRMFLLSPCLAQSCLNNPYMDSLESLGGLLKGKLNSLALLQGAESLRLDSREVDEHVFSSIAGDESVSLRIAEPLNGSSLSFTHCLISLLYGTVVLSDSWTSSEARTQKAAWPPQAWATSYHLQHSPRPTNIVYHPCLKRSNRTSDSHIHKHIHEHIHERRRPTQSPPTPGPSPHRPRAPRRRPARCHPAGLGAHSPSSWPPIRTQLAPPEPPGQAPPADG